MNKSMKNVGPLVALLFFLVTAANVVQAQSSPAPYLTAYRYYDGGQLGGTINAAPNGQGNYLATRYSYDGNQRLSSVETGYLDAWQDETKLANTWTGFHVTKTVLYSYDNDGHKVMEQVQGSDGVLTNVNQYSYDAYDRMICSAVRMNPPFGSLPTGATAACLKGPTSSTYGGDRVNINEYDSLSRVVQIRKAIATSVEQAYVTYNYTGDGLVQYEIDANGNRTQLVYDGLDRLVTMYFPSKTAPTSYAPTNAAAALSAAGAVNTSDYESYGYDDNGNRISLRKRDGQSISYSYDALNRLLVKTVPVAANSVYYGYDLRGLQTIALFGSTSGLGVTNGYDGFGRKTSSTNTTGGNSRRLGYAYDLDGDRKHLTHPDGSYFIYTFDGIDRLNGILENGSASVLTEGYYPYGPRSTEAHSAVSTSYSYDPVQRLSTLTDTLAGTGSITSQFSYSPANQITSRTRDNNAYIYTGFVNGSTSYAANGLNEYSAVGGTTFSSDDNGNLTSDGANTYGYDVENRLTSVSGAHAATLSYDPLGRLFQVVSGSTTTQFLYDGDALVAEYNGSNQLLRRYVHGAGVDNPVLWYEGGTVSSSTRRSLQADHQGSIISVANSSGTSISTNTYDEYGVPGSGNAGRFQYTGQIMIPEAGLYYYKARIYAPKLGRFLQTDPIGYKNDMDLYAYVGNDPMDRTDPRGLCGTPCWVAAGFIIGFGVEYMTRDEHGNGAITRFGNEVWQTAGALIAGGRGVDPLPVAQREMPSTTRSSIPDSHAVVRGGANITPESIAAKTSETKVGPGFSANAASTTAGAATDVPNGKIGVTTAGDIRAAGGEVHDTSNPNNPTHVTVTNLDPQKASELLSPSVPNPVPKSERRCFQDKCQ